MVLWDALNPAAEKPSDSAVKAIDLEHIETVALAQDVESTACANNALAPSTTEHSLEAANSQVSILGDCCADITTPEPASRCAFRLQVVQPPAPAQIDRAASPVADDDAVLEADNGRQALDIKIFSPSQPVNTRLTMPPKVCLRYDSSSTDATEA
eukprot:3028888-Amphidinium_carterae.1